MSAGVTPGRLVGTLGTMISMLAAAGYLAYLAVDKLEISFHTRAGYQQDYR